MDCSIRLCFVAIAFGFVLIINGEPSFSTTPEEANPPQTPIVADSPAEPPSGDFEIDMGQGDIPGNPPAPPPFVPEFPVYIFYLGERKQDDPKLVTQSHLEILKSVLGSEEAANKSMIYSYHHGFSGFAAKLTPADAKKLKNHPEVIILIENRKLVMQTTRTWDYLGLFSTPASSKGLLNETDMGSGAIIGVIDSGIWSESAVYSDNGYEPIPKQWKGECVSADQFSPSDCNKKLIGAKYFMDGLNADLKTSINSSVEHLSPRDHNGHGTQVSSTVAGSLVSNVTFPGLPYGSTMRGGAPKARIAMYKACWDVEGGLCSVADVWKAFDEAIHDGVDVLSISIGGATKIKSLDIEIDIAIPALHAVNRGIPVVSPAGNGGPRSSSVINVSPWILTVAATTLDRSFPTLVTLENNKTLRGESMYTGPEIGFTELMFSWDHEDITMAKGKVAMYFEIDGTVPMPDIVQENGAIGVIYVRNMNDLLDCPVNFPCIYMDTDTASDIYFYMETTTSTPKIKISPSKMVTGERVASRVGVTSARGPSSISPAILKPDIAAPGVSLLTPRIPSDEDTREFAYSGTSMATPVIAGIVALLKMKHPTWSPAAIKSALATTATRTDPHGEPLTAGGSARKLATAFDYGGGLVNMEKATDPGLVYDMDINGYVQYLCSEALYTDKRVSALTGNVIKKCPSSSSSILDLNVPSITIPNLKGNVTVRRTVTNVGNVDSVYKAVVEAPLGFDVKVSPEKLVFNNGTNKAEFTVSVYSGTHKVNTDFFFGSLTWSDGVHNVTIPIAARTRFIDNFFL
ncbi:Subtilisin-like protease [Hirschfeldia incana]|nr:Subtilisin-like protease [Hirschfeldia incana]